MVQANGSMRVLHVAAELFPQVKTGGLGDVLGALPQALLEQGADVRVLLPGLPDFVDAALRGKTRKISVLGPLFGAGRVTLLRTRLPGNPVTVYLIDAPLLYQREGGPYQDNDGNAWSDNLQRFALLGWIAAQLAHGALDPDWAPHIVHAHDWHAGLACAYVAAHPARSVGSVFTIHNLAFQGLFPSGEFGHLGLPQSFMDSQGLEFYGQISFLKAGLVYADRITTVSPTYAREISTIEFGCGLQGVIAERSQLVSGILNGVDREVWDPLTDPHLPAHYSAQDLAGKALCKSALQAEFGLQPQTAAPLFAVVSRLTLQKGLDLVLDAMPGVLRAGAQFAILGSGAAALEAALTAAAQAHPGRVALRLGYDEPLAHRMIAGADAVLVPSRFEPCGLTQLYGLRYGALPVVRMVGGLADTVIDAAVPVAGASGGTGFVFQQATPAALQATLQRAVDTYRKSAQWRGLMQRAMAQNFSWAEAAEQYIALYRTLRIGAV